MQITDNEKFAAIGMTQEEMMPLLDKYLKGMVFEEQKACVEAVSALVTIGSTMGLPIQSAAFAGALRVLADVLDRARPEMVAMQGMAKLGANAPKH